MSAPSSQHVQNGGIQPSSTTFPTAETPAQSSMGPKPPPFPRRPSNITNSSTPRAKPNVSEPTLSGTVRGVTVTKEGDDVDKKPVKPQESGLEERLLFENLLQSKMKVLTDELQLVETDIQNKEEEYITRTWAHGNVMRGWEGFVRRVDRNEKVGGTGSGTATGAPKYRKSKLSDRMFSLCSSTSRFRLQNPDVLIQKKMPDKKKKKKR